MSEWTDRPLGNMTVLYSVTKCLTGKPDVSCTSGIQLQYSTFDVQINSDFQFTVNGTTRYDAIRCEILLPARRYASAGNSYDPVSVCLSVSLSVYHK